MRHIALAFAFVVVGMCLACGDDEPPDGPPQIEYGVTACDRCRMSIVDERFAAAFVTTAGESRVFDDIGGMVIELQKLPKAPERAWVHDVNSKEWIPASDAHYVHCEDLVTPMGYGLAAFRERAAASAKAATCENNVMSWSAVLEHEIEVDARS